MKNTLLLLLALTLMTFRVVAADTNLSQSIKVERSLDDVIRAMQTYYHDTNYHGRVSAVFGTNAVPGVSYTLVLLDCVFHGPIGMLNGEMVATRIAADSTKLELIVKNVTRNEALKDPNTAASFKQRVSKTLEQVAKIAESQR